MRRALPYLLCFLLATSGVPGIARSAERVDELSIGVSQLGIEPEGMKQAEALRSKPLE